MPYAKVRGPSYAQLHGLRGSSDPLGLQTTAVLAYDMDSNEVLYEKMPMKDFRLLQLQN